MRDAVQDTATAVDQTPGRLLHVDPRRGMLSDASIDSLPEILRPEDLLVVNDAATLPASLHGTGRGEPIEIRLAGEGADGTWHAVAFGAGDWRTPTESRPPPPTLAPGDALHLGPGLRARVVSRSQLSPRLLQIRFETPTDGFWSALYRNGRPVQYSYEAAPLALARVQTPYAARPWASEMPSAGRPLRLELLARLRTRGVRVAWLTHAAGLSSTGDAALDAALPLPERYEILPSTVAAVAGARRRGGRVVAVGTTVVRALESAASADGVVRAGHGVASGRIGRETRLRVVDKILTGVHEPGDSHFELLRAFVDDPMLNQISRKLAEYEYRTHEFGDSMLIERETRDRP